MSWKEVRLQMGSRSSLASLPQTGSESKSIFTLVPWGTNPFKIPCSLIQDPVNYSLVNTLKLYELKLEMWRFRVGFAQYIICWQVFMQVHDLSCTKFSCCFVWTGLKMSMESQVKHWTIISSLLTWMYLHNVIPVIFMLMWWWSLGTQSSSLPGKVGPVA